MARDEDDFLGAAAPRSNPSVHVIGQVLDDLSVEELGERIFALQAEILRLDEARKAKQASLTAAAGLFKI
jgi:uncharacterized small protein (DUF1192 family)